MSESVPELVSRFSGGDQAAFAELVRRYRSKIYYLAYRILGNHLDADEVVQETFVRVYKRQKEIANVRNFTAFIIRIATNYSIDLLRRQRGHTKGVDDPDALTPNVQMELSRKVRRPDDTYYDSVVMKEIYSALEKLPPRQKLTAILHDLEGYTKAEIAEALECPEATVRSNLHIARSKLKKILQKRLRE